MKKQISIICLLLVIFSFGFFKSDAQNLSVPIDKGVIAGNFSIQFVELNNVILKPNEPFSLSTLGISASHTGLVTDKDVTTYKNRLKTLGKHKDGCFYKVQITRPGDPVVYYGIMCFFGITAKKAKTEAVARSYQINIPDDHFDNCKGGNVARDYEYWTYIMGIEVPTWLLLFSDSKDLMWN